MKTVNIYTDGACSGNQNDENLGGWGAVAKMGAYGVVGALSGMIAAVAMGAISRVAEAAKKD